MEDRKQLGKYEILDEIGRGGFATVYRARDTVLGREVALKVLDPLLMRDKAFMERFKQEARATAALRHPSLVTIFDLGEAKGWLYIATEYLPKGDLEHQLAEGPLPLSDVARVVEQIGAALDYAHKQNLIHRDVKPSNILFDNAGQAKLADFGIVKVVGTTQFTATGTTLGTPQYMAPEQAEGEELDGRTDLYALGIVAYEMITGQVPFTGKTLSEILYKHVHKPPPPPDEIIPTIPVEISKVLLKALSKKRSERYSTCMDFSSALSAAITLWEQTHWNQLLREVEDMLARGEFDLALGQTEYLARQRPGNPALEQLQTRVQQKLALAATYTEAAEHLQIAVEKAHQVLAVQADYPDRDRVFETLQLRKGQPRRHRKQVDRQKVAAASSVSTRTTPSRDIRTVAWWLLGISILLGLPAFGTGIIGIVGAVGMLKGHSWGRKVGLVFSLLCEVAGFAGAVVIVIDLLSSVPYRGRGTTFWRLGATAIVGMIAGTILAYLLERESIVRGLGEKPTHPSGIWPIATLMALTLLGAVPAVGLLRNRRWARLATMTLLCVLALISIIGVIAISTEHIKMASYWFLDGWRHYGSNGWGRAIAIIEATVLLTWCIIAFFYLKSHRVNAWFQNHSRETTQ